MQQAAAAAADPLERCSNAQQGRKATVRHAEAGAKDSHFFHQQAVAVTAPDLRVRPDVN